jgi:hypothetical protein
VEGVRKARVRGYPQLIYYSIEEREPAVLVLTIQHATRERAFTEG